MAVLRIIPLILSSLLIGTHFLRIGNPGLTATSVLALLLLLVRRSWVPPAFGFLLVLASLMWVQVGLDLAHIRMALGMPWIRMVSILAAVALFTGLSSLAFRTKSLRRWYSRGMNSKVPSAVAFLTTAISLAVVQTKVPLKMLILERFVPGLGWLQILGLSAWAAWVTEKLLDKGQSAIWRKRIWLIFSVVFFAQLAIGLFGFEQFLLTGDLHLPVPALIVVGPVFRGDGFFMPILLGTTLLLVGPAWCSHLCYIGSWDYMASLKRRRPRALPSWAGPVRIAIPVFVPVSAILLKPAGISMMTAGIAALGFGIVGIVIMVTWSRKSGAMTHCAVYCPIGLIANVLGKLSPFRIRIKDGCNDCQKCRLACRYDALNKNHIKNRKPGLNCTLCGDCLSRCEDSQIEYGFAGLSGPRVRTVFLVMVVSLHAIFMGVARM